LQAARGRVAAPRLRRPVVVRRVRRDSTAVLPWMGPPGVEEASLRDTEPRSNWSRPERVGEIVTFL
jgi:hypothetical protein